MADDDLERDGDDEAVGAGAGDTALARPRRVRPFAELEAPAERGPAAYLMEFVGTFGLVFFICTVVSFYAPGAQPATTPGAAPVQPFQDWAVIGLVHAFILFVLIQTAAVVSGADFNPAVTAALAAMRQIRPIDAAIYIVVQLIGAIAG